VRFDPKAHASWVLFTQNNKQCPESECIGRKQGNGEQWITLPFPKYPGFTLSKLQLRCVLHEMMHALGFRHEMARKDAPYHCKSNKHISDSRRTIQFGAYDYRSIMHYRNGIGFKANNMELRRLADRSPTFSQGDLAGLRRIYGQQLRSKAGSATNDDDEKGLVHFGEWHKKCSDQCTETSCGCGACGVLPGGINCGYTGMKGHWSCCLNEEKDSFCNTVHTGFWHMACVGKGCTDTMCVCKSCGGGCTYVGSKGHWSCCNEEEYESKKCRMIDDKKYAHLRIFKEVHGGKVPE